MGRGSVFLIVFGILFATGISHAQTFGDIGGTSSGAKDVLQAETSNLGKPLPAPAQNIISDEELSKALGDEKAALNQEEMLEQVFIPGGGLDIGERPTEDGSKRGDLSVVEINEDGYSRRAEKIFLYYDNFRISSYLSNSATCDMRFIVLTNLDRKLVSLDVKLVWPGMTTALSFSNVEPNTPTYLTYTLMGNGCYNMDQMPNIVVNRCRVRGMNSAECADKIVWLSAVQKK